MTLLLSFSSRSNLKFINIELLFSFHYVTIYLFNTVHTHKIYYISTSDKRFLKMFTYKVCELFAEKSGNAVRILIDRAIDFGWIKISFYEFKQHGKIPKIIRPHKFRIPWILKLQLPIHHAYIGNQRKFLWLWLRLFLVLAAFCKVKTFVIIYERQLSSPLTSCMYLCGAGICDSSCIYGSFG